MLGLSQVEVAERLAVQPSAVSNWERGSRKIPADLHAIDEAFGAGGALAGLLWGVGSRSGLEPNRLWSKIFPGECSPVWMWLRSPSKYLKLEAEWGLFRLDAELELGPNGIFVTVGGSVSQSPVVVQLSEPGWADFGRGELPADLPGADQIAAIDFAVPSSATGTFDELFSANVAERFARSRAQEIASIARDAPELVESFFATFGTPAGHDSHALGPWPPVPEGVASVARHRFERLREARSLSLTATVQLLADRTGVHIGKDTLRRFESDIGQPNHGLLPVALDHVLGADGQLAVAEIRSSQGSGTVRIPPYWHAPVWLEFDGPRRRERMILLWGDWVREVNVALPALLVSHYAEPSSPLKIVAPDDVRWTVGLGRRIGAEPINQNWEPSSLDALRRALAETDLAVVEALKRRTPRPNR